jgi:hypothetical protein
MNAHSLRVYISGPIAGYPDRNEAAFRQAADGVRRRGHTPVVPLDIPGWSHPTEPCPRGYTDGGGHSSACWLRADLLVLLQCDAIVMLKGWEWSQGGIIEHRVAVMVGLPLYYWSLGESLPDAVPNGQRAQPPENHPSTLLSAALKGSR